MKKTIFVTGGSRSGKTSAALQMAEASEGPLLYIATAEALDDEMKARIEAHQRERGDRWTTLEETLDLAGAIRKSEGYGAILIDCLTLWTSNMMHVHNGDPGAVETRLADFAQVLSERKANVVIVTNEVGMGIVPAGKLSREFRDLAGKINRKISLLSDEAYLVVSGRLLKLL